MPLDTEYRMMGRDGSIVWVHDHAATVRGTDGEPLYVRGYLQDVTAQHEMRSEGDSLRTEARTAAAEAAHRQKRLDLLARADVVLTASMDAAPRFRAAQLVVDGFADWCVLDLVDEKGTQAGPSSPEATDPVVGAPKPETEPAVVKVIETGDAVLAEHRICVPMVGRSRTLGAVTLSPVTARGATGRTTWRSPSTSRA